MSRLVDVVPQNIEDLEQWLAQHSNRERSGDYSDWKLDPVYRCLAALQLPRPLRPITVAGTKGKGSTVAFLEGVLRAHGRRTLAFTSPHIRSVLERWRDNGAPVELPRLAAHCPRVDRALALAQHNATYFERCFLLACCLAAEDAESIFICEVGLGGRLDCANALHAQCVCLTSLGLDHTQILGPTIAHIAREKLGVCRPDAPLYIAPQSSQARRAIQEHLPPVAAQHWCQPVDEACRLGLPGDHQRDNAGLAWAAAQDVLGDAFAPDQARQGLAQVSIPARCQLLQYHGRPILVDGAHTAESLAASLSTAHSLWGNDYQVLFACAADKDLAGLCAVIGDQRAVLRCGYAWERCVQAQDARWPSFAQTWPWHACVGDALSSIANDQQPLLITGSFYLAGEALAHCSAAGQP